MYVVIPMAGAGSRFSEAGYKSPKPLIDVLGKTMIHRVVENLDLPEAKHVFIVQKEHRKQFSIDQTLNDLIPSCTIIETNGLLPGALLSVLQASEVLEVDDELIIANSDQLVVTRTQSFIHHLRAKSADGGLMTFRTSGKSWSYAIVNKHGEVERVAEKEEISDQATIGVYYWKSSKYFLDCASRFIEKALTTNGEYYVSPVFNEAISEGKNVLAVSSPKHVSLGTPELLETYIKQTRRIDEQ